MNPEKSQDTQVYHTDFGEIRIRQLGAKFSLKWVSGPLHRDATAWVHNNMYRPVAMEIVRGSVEQVRTADMPAPLPVRRSKPYSVSDKTSSELPNWATGDA